MPLEGKKTERAWLMIEIRWVNVGDGNLQLQQRTRIPRVDGSGAFCDFTAWSEWAAVPIVHDPRQVASVVDVFPTR